MKYINLILLSFSLFLFNCANQQPPGGGEEDKIPPEIVSISPKNNTVNFRGNVISIELSEYVDKRSFIDALRISPPAGEYEVEWSGTTAEIQFRKPPFRTNSNKTFLISLNSNLKDINGNSIESPFNLAFATGPEIDKGLISGNVYNNRNKVITVFAYNISGSESDFDPVNRQADYYTETGTNGNYTLSNLAPGLYRMLAVEDEDRNIFYTVDRENFGVLDRDISLVDSLQINDVNFNLNITNIKTGEIDLSRFSSDSVGLVHSSIDSASLILPEGSIFFYFKNYKFDRTEFAKRLTFNDAGGNLIKPVINWRNDTVVEVFPSRRLEPSRSYTIRFNVDIDENTVYNYILPFRTFSNNSFGDISGSIIQSLLHGNSFDYVISLNSQAATAASSDYSVMTRDTVFQIRNVLQGSYALFAYIDINGNGRYDYGKVIPFTHSEPFYSYPSEIKIKAGWTVENIIINFRSE